MSNNSNNYDKYPKLDEREKYFIRIPRNIIFDTSLGKNRVGVFAYLSCKTSLDSKFLISMRLICNWLNRRIDTHSNNKGVKEICGLVDKYKEMGIVDIDEEVQITKMIEGRFHKDKVQEMIDNKNGFGTIYVDEIEKILNYRNKSKREWWTTDEEDEDIKIDTSYVLLVFAYLRSMIIPRNNLAGAAHRTETFDGYYRQIEDEIGLSERKVSQAISVLIKVGLIYERKRPPIVKYYYVDGKRIKKHVPQTSIFCNTYKRLNGHLIDYGESYYMKEADDKEKELNENQD